MNGFVRLLLEYRGPVRARILLSTYAVSARPASVRLKSHPLRGSVPMVGLASQACRRADAERRTPRYFGVNHR